RSTLVRTGEELSVEGDRAGVEGDRKGRPYSIPLPGGGAWWTEKIHVVDVFFHAGVTDTLAESVLVGARMLCITDIERVEMAHRYLLDERLSEDEVRTIVESLLYNPVIQQYILHAGELQGDRKSKSQGDRKSKSQGDRKGGESQGDRKGRPYHTT